MVEEQEILNRWRLVLGKYAAEQILFSEGDGGEKLKVMEMEDVLDYLYSREYGEEQEIRQDRRGGSLRFHIGSRKLKRFFREKPLRLWSAMHWKNTG